MTKVRLPAIGFWSYARIDDDLSDDNLTRLRELIKREIQLQFGRGDITLFQDTAAIPHGAHWERETFDALGQATFFVPIVTPNFIQSEWCARETEFFLERERQLCARHPDLPQRSRIFPIDYRKIRDADACKPEILAALRTRQWCAFQDLRHEELAAKVVKARISEFAETICDLLTIEVAPPLSPEEMARRAAEAKRQRAAEAKRLRAAEAEQARAAEAERRRAEAIAREEEEAEALRTALTQAEPPKFNMPAADKVLERIRAATDAKARAQAEAEARAARRLRQQALVMRVLATLALTLFVGLTFLGFTPGMVVAVTSVVIPLAALPIWAHSRHWGYAPAGLLGALLLLAAILVLLGKA